MGGGSGGLPYRHPGLDPGSTKAGAALKSWIPDQVRDDEIKMGVDQAQGGAFRPVGLAVKISQPVSVIPILCSNCADRLRSRVTAVQPSLSIFTAYLPVLIIGSIVKNMPGLSSGPVPGRPA